MKRLYGICREQGFCVKDCGLCAEIEYKPQEVGEDVAVRAVVVGKLKDKKLSTTAVAKQLGVDPSTVDYLYQRYKYMQSRNQRISEEF
jgi:hypothetical protein